MARKSRQVETRMVAEYLKLNYSKFPFIMDVPLGRLDPEALATQGIARTANMLRPFRPRADAIVILPRYLVVIEAKVWNVVNGLAKIPLYKSLIPFTPELAQYKDYDILMEMVVGRSDANLEIMARDMGVTLRLYAPAWLAEVVDGMNKYWTKEYQAARQEKQQLREYFNVE